MTRIEEIRARVEAATPGDWGVGWNGGLTGPRCGPAVYLDGHPVVRVPIHSGDSPVCWLLASGRYASESDMTPDAEFIANAKQDVPYLINRVAELEAALRRAVELLDATRRFMDENPIQEYTVVYDEARCDGACLATDCRIAIEEAKTALEPRP